MLVAIAGCGILDPDPICGCTPPLHTKSMTGEVQRPVEAPIGPVRVITESFRDDDPTAAIVCGETGQAIVRTETLASGSGSFSTLVRWDVSQACARIWAETQSGTPIMVSDTLIYPLDVATASAPVNDIVLQLRETSSP